MTRRPKRTELLRLFLGQPLLMTIFVLVVTVVLSILAGVGGALVEAFVAKGWAAFLPSKSVVHAAVLFGIAFGVFNIACDSAEMDTVLRYQRPALPTYLLVILSLAFVDGSAQILIADTWLVRYASLLQLGLVATCLMAAVELAVLRSHFAQCQGDLQPSTAEN